MRDDEVAAHLTIRALAEQYALCADERNAPGLADLFTVDGELVAVHHDSETPFFRASGRAELAEVVHGNDDFPRTMHLVGNHQCTINGPTASGITYCMAHHLRSEQGQAESTVWLIRYHDQYVNTPSGWRFASRTMELMWVEYVDSDASAFPFRKGWPGV